MSFQGSVVRQLVGAEILVVDQDPEVQTGMHRLLDQARLNVTCVGTPEEAYEQLTRRFFSAAVVDLDTPVPGAGLATIAFIKETSPTTMIVLLTPRKSFGDGVEALRRGAIDIVFKAPGSVPYLKDRILQAASRSVDTREVNSLLVEIKGAHDEFLQLFMDAERRNVDLQDRVAGRDPNLGGNLGEIKLLIADANTSLAQTLAEQDTPGYLFRTAVSGGQALDMCGSDSYHYVLVGENLVDLPVSWVIRSIKNQYKDTVVLAFSGPGPGGKIELVETTKRTVIVPRFASPTQLLERLDDLAEAFRAKTRESRYTRTFRERHYNFLRRYVDLKMKIERTLASDQPEES